MANTDEWWKPANNGNVIFFPAILGGSAQIISLIDPLQKKNLFLPTIYWPYLEWDIKKLYWHRVACRV